MARSSKRAGTCASRASPERPSEMLKQMCGRRRWRESGSVWSAGRKVTQWPSASSACAIASTVSCLSNSAPASGGASAPKWTSDFKLARRAPRHGAACRPMVDLVLGGLSNSPTSSSGTFIVPSLAPSRRVYKRTSPAPQAERAQASPRPGPAPLHMLGGPADVVVVLEPPLRQVERPVEHRRAEAYHLEVGAAG